MMKREILKQVQDDAGDTVRMTRGHGQDDAGDTVRMTRGGRTENKALQTLEDFKK